MHYGYMNKFTKSDKTQSHENTTMALAQSDDHQINTETHLAQTHRGSLLLSSLTANASISHVSQPTGNKVFAFLPFVSGRKFSTTPDTRPELCKVLSLPSKPSSSYCVSQPTRNKGFLSFHLVSGRKFSKQNQQHRRKHEYQ